MFSFSWIDAPTTFSPQDMRILAIVSYLEQYVPLLQHGHINGSCIDTDTMRSLNAKYRNKNQSTDVLSFHYFDDFSNCTQDEIVGECVFSESHIIEQAQSHHITPAQECEILLIHSMLHILGFDHENDTDFTQMWHHEQAARIYFSLPTNS